MTSYGKYPDAFYRVSVKAVIRNNKGEILCVCESERDMWELPGGGLDHGETVQQGLARELKEEIGYEGDFTFNPVDVSTLYTAENERCTMNIAFDVVLGSPKDIRKGDSVFDIAYKDPAQFANVDYRGGQLIYKHAVDHSFPIKFDRR